MEELDDDEEEDWDEEGEDGRREAESKEEDVGRDKENITNLFKDWKDERRNRRRSMRQKITRLSEQTSTEKQCLNTMETPYLYPQGYKNTKRHNCLNR